MSSKLNLLASVAVLSLFTSPAAAQATISGIIDNGTIALGVNREGNLIVRTSGDVIYGGDSSFASDKPDLFGGDSLAVGDLGAVGLTFIPTAGDPGAGEALAPGCFCEGWGIADLGTGFFAQAGEVFGDENINDAGLTFAGTGTLLLSTGASATSIVTTDLGTEDEYDLSVTHAFAPSVSQNLYRVDVTIRNNGEGPVARLVYRRAMDWDVPPTSFNELVTIGGTDASALLASSDDGFAGGDPHDPLDSVISADAVVSGDFVDSGPEDHGAAFDFDFGALAPGQEVTFVIYYGAAATEAEAFAALEAVGAEVYSFGQSNVGGTSEDGTILVRDGFAANTTGAPNTFIFAFSGVGGTPISAPGPGGTDLFLNVYRDLQSIIMQNHTGAVASFAATDTGSAMVYEVERQLSQGASVVEDAFGVNGLRMWIQGDFQFGNSEAFGPNRAFDYAGGGGTLGVDWAVPGSGAGDLTVGASVGYHVVLADVDLNFSSLEVDAFTGSLYAAVKMPEGPHARVELGYGLFSYEQSRDPRGLAGGPFAGSPFGFAVALDVEGGYELAPIALGEGLSAVIDPFAGFTAEYRSTESFQETGGGVFVDEFSDTSLEFRIGSRATLAYETGSERLFAFAEVAYAVDVLDSDETVAINVGALADEQIRSTDDGQLRVKLAFGADIDDRIRALVQYQGGFTIHSDQHAFSARVDFAL